MANPVSMNDMARGAAGHKHTWPAAVCSTDGARTVGSREGSAALPTRGRTGSRYRGRKMIWPCHSSPVLTSAMSDRSSMA